MYDMAEVLLVRELMLLRRSRTVGRAKRADEVRDHDPGDPFAYPAGVLLGWGPLKGPVRKELAKMLDKFVAAHPEFR